MNNSQQVRLEGWFVAVCTWMPAEDIEAKQLLKRHFADEMKITNAYLDKALNRTVIIASDAKSLHAYALYLRECCNAMQDLDYTDELDVTFTIKRREFKLP